jgi:hypothetical protein
VVTADKQGTWSAGAAQGKPFTELHVQAGMLWVVGAAHEDTAHMNAQWKLPTSRGAWIAGTCTVSVSDSL